MMAIASGAAIAALLAASAVSAGQATVIQPGATATVVAAPAVAGVVTLREGTPVSLNLEEPLSSKSARVGDRFRLTVAESVKVNGVTVIPVGSPGIGEVTNVVKKGAFGKSGKLDTRVLSVKVGDGNINLTGVSREAGAGGTGVTVAVAVLAGVFSAFVTGKSAELPVGTKMTGFVGSDTAMSVTPVAAATAGQTLP